MSDLVAVSRVIQDHVGGPFSPFVSVPVMLRAGLEKVSAVSSPHSGSTHYYYPTDNYESRGAALNIPRRRPAPLRSRNRGADYWITGELTTG